MGAARHRFRLRRCAVRTGFEVPNPLGKNAKGPERDLLHFGGEGGIRTHEGLQTLAGFQDQCIQPLCHLSNCLWSFGYDQCIDSRHPWRSPFGRATRVQIGCPADLSTALPPLRVLNTAYRFVAHCALMGGRIQHRVAEIDGSMVSIAPYGMIPANPLPPLWSD